MDSSFHHNVSAKKTKTPKVLNHCVLERVRHLFKIFGLEGGGDAQREMYVLGSSATCATAAVLFALGSESV